MRSARVSSILRMVVRSLVSIPSPDGWIRELLFVLCCPFFFCLPAFYDLSRPWSVILLPLAQVSAGRQSHGAYNTGKGRSKQNNNIVYGFCLVKGKAKHHIEDFHHAEFKKINQVELGLFAIYDGHLSHTVPHYLQNHLLQTIVTRVEFTVPSCGWVHS
jgi:hypothetical protein